jgi:hypothetical protein
MPNSSVTPSLNTQSDLAFGKCSVFHTLFTSSTQHLSFGKIISDVRKGFLSAELHSYLRHAIALTHCKQIWGFEYVMSLPSHSNCDEKKDVVVPAMFDSVCCWCIFQRFVLGNVTQEDTQINSFSDEFLKIWMELEV